MTRLMQQPIQGKQITESANEISNKNMQFRNKARENSQKLWEQVVAGSTEVAF